MSKQNKRIYSLPWSTSILVSKKGKIIASIHAQYTSEKVCFIIYFDLFDFLFISHYQPGWWQTMASVWFYHLTLLFPISIYMLWRISTKERHTVRLGIGLNSEKISVTPRGSIQELLFKDFINVSPSHQLWCVFLGPGEQEIGWGNLKIGRQRNSEGAMK